MELPPFLFFLTTIFKEIFEGILTVAKEKNAIIPRILTPVDH